MADVITETDGIGFSVQAVADRAGLTHRTIYNYFPTREALLEAFAGYVDELLTASTGQARIAAPSLLALPAMAGDLYRIFERRDRHVRAYVMLMIGNRFPLESWRRRTRAFERQIARQAGAGLPLPPRQVAAAIRLFVSTIGWHVMTEQCGLSTEEAAAACAWATRTLLEAATGRRVAAPPSRTPRRGTHAKRGNTRAKPARTK